MQDRLIATLAVGDEANSIARYSLPLIEAYARRCGADLLQLQASSLSDDFNIFYEKFQLGPLLERYRRILYVDVDILILPDSPDVFALAPEDHFAAVSVDPVFRRGERSRSMTQQVLGPVDWRHPYFNAGLMLVSRGQQALFTPGEDMMRHWHEGAAALGEGSFHDQDLFNYRLNALGLPFHDLGRAFNFTRAWGDFHRRFGQNFIHYAGLKGQRDALMARDARVLARPWQRRLYARCPQLVWVRDRLWR